MGTKEYTPMMGGYALGAWKTERGALNAVRRYLVRYPGYDLSYARLEVWTWDGPRPVKLSERPLSAAEVGAE